MSIKRGNLSLEEKKEQNRKDNERKSIRKQNLSLEDKIDQTRKAKEKNVN